MAHTSRRIGAARLALLLGHWSDGRGALYRLLASRLGAIIDAGLLDNGDRLPAERRLAVGLAVARGTVVRAYDELAAGGRVTRTRGSGTYVTSTPRLSRQPVGRPTARLIEPTWTLDLRVARPPLLDSVRQLVDRPLLGAATPSDLDAGDPAGLRALRVALADLMSRDGLATTPDQLLVTSGGQHGAMLLALHLLERRGDVAVEQATWPGFADTVAHLGGRVLRVPLTADGIDLAALDALRRQTRLSFIALNPHHHNPTGTRLSDARRAQLASLTTEAGVPLVEDRVLARLAFDRHVPPPLAATATAHHRPELHVTLDSLDKVAWPGLRVGWIRATPSTIQQLRTLRAMTDFAPPVQPQLAALAVLDHLDRIVDEHVTQLRARCDELFDALPATIPGAAATRPRGGIVVWVRLPRGSGNDFARHAARHGVSIPSAADFGAALDDPHVRLPLTLGADELATAMARLSTAWTTYPAP